MLIPKLFDAIRLGNVKSECVLGDRIIGHRQVRLKLVAEVVDPGSNPLQTHSQSRAASGVHRSSESQLNKGQSNKSQSNKNQSNKSQSNKSQSSVHPSTTDANAIRSVRKRGPRRKHPLSQR